MIDQTYKKTLFIICIASLSACATPQTRIKNALIDKGLSEPLAGCMADKMADKLSTGQLLKIKKLEKFEKKNAGDISANDFIKYTRALQDPDILAITTSSIVTCSF